MYVGSRRSIKVKVGNDCVRNARVVNLHREGVMSRGNKKRSYEHARRLVRWTNDSRHAVDSEEAVYLAYGTFRDFRVGMALCALLGISTCVAPPSLRLWRWQRGLL